MVVWRAFVIDLQDHTKQFGCISEYSWKILKFHNYMFHIIFKYMLFKSITWRSTIHKQRIVKSSIEQICSFYVLDLVQSFLDISNEIFKFKNDFKYFIHTCRASKWELREVVAILKMFNFNLSINCSECSTSLQ